MFLNGRLVPKEQAVVSVFDHGLLYGDGVFEGIRAYNGRVFRLQEHLERLYRSARAIVLDIGMPLADMEKAVLDTLRANKLKDAYIRLVVTRGVGDLGLDPKKCPKATVFIIADRIALYPPECYTEGLEVNTVSTRRNSSQALNPNIKSLNYLNNILAKIEAGLSGAREAIMLSLEGYVAECTGDNIFFIKGNRLVTPPTVAGALEGITRAVVWGLASGAGLVPEEMLFTPFDLFTADEVFLTGTAAEVIPVVRIDARTIGAGRPGPKTQKLIQAFRELAGREGTPI
ncbi:MAG TPA: branched-chain-amino-acid transaminase [Elusimicrobiota bacterium]|nr:branched-chain-amino-acid transaminase [Elusimicrobiota bacterium]